MKLNVSTQLYIYSKTYGVWLLSVIAPEIRLMTYLKLISRRKPGVDLCFLSPLQGAGVSSGRGPRCPWWKVGVGPLAMRVAVDVVR